MPKTWHKSRVGFLAIGVILVALSLVLILPALSR